MMEAFMKHTLLAGIAAIALIAGSGLASAQSQQAPVASPQSQPNTQARDQEGTPGTGMSEPAPAQNRGTTGQRAPAGTMAPAPAASGQQPFTGGTANPAASSDSRDRDQEGTPGTGKSAPAPAGSPRQ
jgi:hypothetical protein